ncbi:MAG: sensor domain-containing protein, partial [Chloroflexota bacterium]
MSYTIDNYLDELKQALKGSDKAIIQDALADSQEHLSTALEDALAGEQDQDEALALSRIIAQYGTPEETAAAYREIEMRTATSYAAKPARSKSAMASFFGIYSDPRAWGGMLYMLISLLLGVVYFDWAIVALSITLVFIIILAIFFRSVATFYLLSIEGLALMEGRIVEALLHVRMPRRPLLHPKDLPWKERLKHQISDQLTWKKLLYMLLSMPLGVIYFSAIITMLSLSFAGFFAPVLQEVWGDPILRFGSLDYFMPNAAYPVSILAGMLLLTLTLHFSKG